MKIEIYSQKNCKYCDMAKIKLQTLNLDYEEILITSQKEMDELQNRVPNARSVPQIFINEMHTGGYQETDWDAVAEMAKKETK